MRKKSHISLAGQIMDSMELDNVFDYMAGKELTEIGIDMDQLLPKPLPFKQQLHKSTIERKAKIDISEVKNLQAEMSGFHEYFKTKED